ASLRKGSFCSPKAHGSLPVKQLLPPCRNSISGASGTCCRKGLSERILMKGWPVLGVTRAIGVTTPSCLLRASPLPLGQRRAPSSGRCSGAGYDQLLAAIAPIRG